MQKTALFGSLLVNALLAGWLLFKSPAQRHIEGGYWVSNQGPIAIMTEESFPGTRLIIVYQDDRFYWTIETNLLILNVGHNESITLSLDGSGRHIRKTLLEGLGGSGETVYITDSNADGIPEERKTGNKRELFIGGAFYPTKRLGDNQIITMNNHERVVHFDRIRWKIQETSAP